ncbi:MAG: FCD domain-containing protein [Ilumatobacteraceae bacterium]
MQVIEPYAARLAKRAGTADHWARMHEVLDSAHAPGRSGAELIELDRSCHEIVWEAADNRFLTDTLDMLYAQSDRVWHMYLADVDDMVDAVDEHAQILAALRVRPHRGRGRTHRGPHPQLRRADPRRRAPPSRRAARRLTLKVDTTPADATAWTRARRTSDQRTRRASRPPSQDLHRCRHRDAARRRPRRRVAQRRHHRLRRGRSHPAARRRATAPAARSRCHRFRRHRTPGGRRALAGRPGAATAHDLVAAARPAAFAPAVRRGAVWLVRAPVRSPCSVAAGFGIRAWIDAARPPGRSRRSTPPPAPTSYWTFRSESVGLDGSPFRCVPSGHPARRRSWSSSSRAPASWTARRS